MPPPPAVPEPPAAHDQRRDYPILLAQRMRESRWVNAQVLLVGQVECYSPDPLTLLNVGNRYEVNHRDVRAARAALSPPDREHVLAYLLREDELVKRQDEDGNWYWKPVPPPMRDEEAQAFRALWRLLAARGALHGLTRPPRPKPAPAAPATE